MGQQGENKAFGTFFEDTVERFARYSQILPLRNGTACRIIPGGGVKLLKSRLDFELINRQGKHVHLDCKAFVRDFFTTSQLNPDQLEQAVILSEYGVTAGFLVWFRKVNLISFYLGVAIRECGARYRFLPRHGLSLGKLETLRLPLLF